MLRVRVLGAVGADRDGHAITIASQKQRVLLAVLAARNGPVSRARLIDALWPESPPPSATSTLLGYVSRLRSALGAGAVVGIADGYRLVAEEVDAREFEALAAANDLASLERALALWSGDAFGDLADHPFLSGEAARLREIRIDARLRVASAHLASPESARPISMLEAIVADAPLREDAWALLVRSLIAAGRPAEAVRAAHRCRRQLADIGLEPSPALLEAEALALAQRFEPAASAATEQPTPGPVRYAQCGGVHLAHQLIGGGPVDVVLSSYGSISIDSIWDSDHFTRFVAHIARSCRVVLYDTRGVGLSDPIDVVVPPTIEEQAEDLRCVIADAHAEPAVVVGIGDGGPTAITCAYAHPDAVAGLVLINTFARLVAADDHPIGVPQKMFHANVAMSVDPDTRRDTSLVLRNHAPSVAGDAEFRRWWDRAGRRGASPSTAAALWNVRYGADVRALLPELTVPTLVIHRRRTKVVPRRFGRHLADAIPGARLLEMDGADQPPFTEGAVDIADAIASFATPLATH